MKKIYIKTRLVSLEGKTVTQVKLTQAILSNPLNKGVTLQWGWRELLADSCTSPKPDVPPGQYGDYICVDGEWVFIKEV